MAGMTQSMVPNRSKIRPNYYKSLNSKDIYHSQADLLSIIKTQTNISVSVWTILTTSETILNYILAVLMRKNRDLQTTLRLK